MTRPLLEVADVVRPYGDAYLARYGAVTAPAQRRVLQAVGHCRTAVLGGHIEAVVSADYGPQVAAGKVKLVVLTGSEKLASQPALPTFKDLNYPISTEAIYGLFGPAKLPRDVVAYWDAATREMMATDEFKATLKTASANAAPM